MVSIDAGAGAGTDANASSRDAPSEGRPASSAHSAEPPNSARVSPSTYSRLPAPLRSIVTAWRTSDIKPSAEMSSVGGMGVLRPDGSTYSLLSESLPETKGAP